MNRAIFGWSYPAGCHSVPGDEDMPMPEVGEIVLLGDKRGIVIATWTASDDKVPDWANEGDWEDILVAFHEEDTPRSVALQDLIPDDGPLVVPSMDGHSVGVCSETTGILYFDLDKFGGQWYASAIWDNGRCSHDQFIDLGPFESELAAMRTCADSGYDSIHSSDWQTWCPPDDVDRIAQELIKEWLKLVAELWPSHSGCRELPQAIGSNHQEGVAPMPEDNPQEQIDKNLSLIASWFDDDGWDRDVSSVLSQEDILDYWHELTPKYQLRLLAHLYNQKKEQA